MGAGDYGFHTSGLSREIREGIFNKGIGLVKDIGNTTLIKFDSMGNILIKKEFPQKAPGLYRFYRLWLSMMVSFLGLPHLKIFIILMLI
jgi:hypothetical protein